LHELSIKKQKPLLALQYKRIMCYQCYILVVRTIFSKFADASQVKENKACNKSPESNLPRFFLNAYKAYKQRYSLLTSILLIALQS